MNIYEKLDLTDHLGLVSIYYKKWMSLKYETKSMQVRTYPKGLHPEELLFYEYPSGIDRKEPIIVKLNGDLIMTKLQKEFNGYPIYAIHHLAKRPRTAKIMITPAPETRVDGFAYDWRRNEDRLRTIEKINKLLQFPHSEFPHSEFPHSEFPHSEFPPTDTGGKKFRKTNTRRKFKKNRKSKKFRKTNTRKKRNKRRKFSKKLK